MRFIPTMAMVESPYMFGPQLDICVTSFCFSVLCFGFGSKIKTYVGAEVMTEKGKL